MESNHTAYSHHIYFLMHLNHWPTASDMIITAHCATKQPGILIEQAAHDWAIEKLPGSHHLPLLGKVKTAGQSCGFRASSGGSLKLQLKPWVALLIHFIFDKFAVQLPCRPSYWVAGPSPYSPCRWQPGSPSVSPGSWRWKIQLTR